MESSRTNPFLNIYFYVAVGVLGGILAIGLGSGDSLVAKLVLLALVAIAAAATIGYRPRYGAYLLIIMMFANVSAIITDMGGPGINKPLLLLVTVSIIGNQYFRGKGQLPTLSIFESLVLVYMVTWMASVFVADDKSVAMGEVVEMAKNFAIIFCLIHAIRTPQELKQSAWLLIILATILAGMSTYQIVTGNFSQTFFGFASAQEKIVVEDYQMRIAGPLGHTNFWGQVLVAVLPLAIYRLFDREKPIYKTGLAVTVTVLIVSIFNTYSRGAFVAMVLVLLLCFLERRLKWIVVLLALFLGLNGLAFLPEEQRERFESLLVFTGDDEGRIFKDKSFRGRSSEMQAGILMLQDHPLLGVGAGNYPSNYQTYARKIGLEWRTEQRDAHSLYIEILAETGLLGFAAFATLFAFLLVRLNQVRKRLADHPQLGSWQTWIASLQMSLIGYLTTSIFLHGDFIRYLWIFFALAAIGVQLSEKLLEETARQKPKVSS